MPGHLGTVREESLSYIGLVATENWSLASKRCAHNYSTYQCTFVIVQLCHKAGSPRAFSVTLLR